MTDSQYTKQLEKLKLQFAEFTQKNSPMHNANALDVNDPDVENIINAFAYLTGRLHEHVETKHNDFYQVISQQMLGSLILAKPSVILTKYDAVAPIDSSGFIIEEGTEFSSGNTTDKGDTISYSTAYDCYISPIELESVIEEVVEDGSNFIFTINNNCNDRENSKLNQFIFHITGEFVSSVNLFSLLSFNIDSIVLRGFESSKIYNIPVYKLTPYGYDRKSGLFDSNEFDLDELNQLLEYALAPQKLLAYKLDLSGFGEELFRENNQVIIKISCKHRDNFPYPSFNREVLKSIHSNVVPLVNTFAGQSVPSQIDHRDHIIPVEVARSNGQQSVYAVEYVSGVLRKDGQDFRRVYTDFNEYVISGGSRSLSYQVRQGQENAGNPSLSIQLAYGKDEEILIGEVVVCNIKITNGEFARINEDSVLSLNAKEDVYGLRFLKVVSDYVPALRAEDQEAAFAYDVSIARQTLSSATDLQGLLGYVLFLCGQGENKRFLACLDSILDLDFIEGSNIKGLDVVYGQKIHLKVNAGRFESIGDVYLFGLIMNRLFASYAPVNYFSQLTIFSGEDPLPLFEMPIIIGDNYLIDGKVIH